MIPAAIPGTGLRAKGVAPVLGLTRVTMDDRVNSGTRGDSLLRKIDFQYDHFVSGLRPKWRQYR